MPVSVGRSVWRGMLDVEKRIWEEGRVPDMSQEEIETWKRLHARGVVCKCGCNGRAENSKEETDVG